MKPVALIGVQENVSTSDREPISVALVLWSEFNDLNHSALKVSNNGLDTTV